jgi:pyruvate/2-oxoglutarate dehydrogenase complex dihydrolipoamide acyltransferase (E2) component
LYQICLAFGSINEQPVIRKRLVETGRILHLAPLVDHDVIDGVPASAFVDDLVTKMEKAIGCNRLLILLLW